MDAVDRGNNPPVSYMDGFKTFCSEAYESTCEFTKPVLEPVFKFTATICDAAKKATSSLDGLLQTSNLVIAANEFFSQTGDILDSTVNFHVFKTFAGMCEDYKKFKSSGNLANVGDDLHKKVWWDSERAKNKDGSFSILGAIENCIAIAKRICMTAVSILGFIEFSQRLGWVADFAVQVGTVSVKLIALLAGTVLGFFENMFAFGHNVADRRDLAIKKEWISLKEGEVKPELRDMFTAKKDRLRAKLAAAELPAVNQMSYVELKYRVSYQKVVKSITSKKADMKATKAEINQLKDKIDKTEADSSKMQKLNDKIRTTFAEIHNLKYQRKGLGKIFNGGDVQLDESRFAAFKKDQFETRLENLDLRRLKTILELVVGALKTLVFSFAIAKSVVGLDGLTNGFNVDSEEVMKLSLALLSLVSSSFGFFKFMHEEYNKEEKKILSFADFDAPQLVTV